MGISLMLVILLTLYISLIHLLVFKQKPNFEMYLQHPVNTSLPVLKVTDFEVESGQYRIRTVRDLSVIQFIFTCMCVDTDFWTRILVNIGYRGLHTTSYYTFISSRKRIKFLKGYILITSVYVCSTWFSFFMEFLLKKSQIPSRTLYNMTVIIGTYS